ncbi:hypothetical protein POM88_042072 [Heracleum sosnowskyi]|uniref:Uncharacterized protein n=1 Tax=Heracleum sosnowskyi TaxID=360622 RepID=A0AAD8MAB9_9APIA|nr:hypothetical protein POM88_042072 [Heracleum sosnowskyi]
MGQTFIATLGCHGECTAVKRTNGKLLHHLKKPIKIGIRFSLGCLGSDSLNSNYVAGLTIVKAKAKAKKLQESKKTTISVFGKIWALFFAIGPALKVVASMNRKQKQPLLTVTGQRDVMVVKWPARTDHKPKTILLSSIDANSPVK